MKKVLGIIIVTIGTGLSLYLGGWVMFIGGIAGLVDVVKTSNFENIAIAKNIVKIMFSNAVIYIGMQLSVIIAGLLTGFWKE